MALGCMRTPEAVRTTLSQSFHLQSWKSLLIDSLVTDSFQTVLGVAPHTVYHSCMRSHFCLASLLHCVVARTQGHWRVMMICVQYIPGAAGPLGGTHKADFALFRKLLSYQVISKGCISSCPFFLAAGCASRPTWAQEGFRTSARSSDSSNTWWWTRPSKRTSSLRAQWRTSTVRP